MSSGFHTESSRYKQRRRKRQDGQKRDKVKPVGEMRKRDRKPVVSDTNKRLIQSRNVVTSSARHTIDGKWRTCSHMQIRTQPHKHDTQDTGPLQASLDMHFQATAADTEMWYCWLKSQFTQLCNKTLELSNADSFDRFCSSLIVFLWQNTKLKSPKDGWHTGKHRMIGEIEWGTKTISTDGCTWLSRICRWLWVKLKRCRYAKV